MIRRRICLVLTVLLLLAFAQAAFAAPVQPQTGALTLEEMENWLKALEDQTAAQQPMNAPVGEESLTPDGYAYLYDTFTLYYNSTGSDAQLMQAILTDPGTTDPRGIAVGDDQSVLLAAYGWQNPDLMGDGTVAALYLQNELPADARWAWAICSGQEVLSLQCTVHSALGDGMYTDMGIRYQLNGGKVESISLYGLDCQGIAASDMLANLDEVSRLMAQLSGDDHTASGRWNANGAQPFGVADLSFAGLDFLTLKEADVAALYGDAASTDVLPEMDGFLYLTTQRDGLQVAYLESADGSVVKAESIAITTPMLEGPRGLRVGMTLEEALALFCCDGSGRVMGSANLLYGDGLASPYGLEQPDGMGGTEVRYLCEAESPNGLLTVTLYLTFQQDLLTEIYLYAW